MTPIDKREFDKALCAALSVYDKQPPDESVVDIWMSVLSLYSLEQVRNAMRKHVSNCKFAPKPADIIEIINAHDGRPTADEAWPIALQASDEMATAVWTSEIEQAWHHCYPVFEVGDEIGARMAFRQHYQKLIDHARMHGLPVKWNVSLGHDPSQRITALEVAEQKGFLTHDRVEALLPAPEPQGDGQHIAALVGYDGKKDAAPSEDVKANLKKLRDALAAPTQSKADIESQRKAEELKRREHLAEQERLLAEAQKNYQGAAQ